MKIALIGLSLLTLATVADAQPSLTALQPAPVTEPTVYGSLGVMMGVDREIDTGVTAEVGARLTSVLWAHAQLSRGTASQIDFFNDPPPSGSFSQTRVGLEARPCVREGVACGVLGVDAGLQHESWNGDTSDVVRVYPRIGFDVGTPHVRVRPTFELNYGADGLDGGSFLIALGGQR